MNFGPNDRQENMTFSMAFKAPVHIQMINKECSVFFLVKYVLGRVC
jgi:hypothetical protein